MKETKYLKAFNHSFHFISKIHSIVVGALSHAKHLYVKKGTNKTKGK